MSILYRQVPSYMELYNDDSKVTKRPFRWGVPSYTALYPALRRKQPPRKPLDSASAPAREKESCVIVKI